MRLLVTIVCALVVDHGHSFRASSFASRSPRKATSSHSVACCNGLSGLNNAAAIRDAAMSVIRSNPTGTSLLTAVGVNTAIFAPFCLSSQKMLTPAGVANAFLLGIVLWRSIGWQGWSLCVLYLALGSKVTKVRMEEKEKLGISEGRGGRYE